MRGDIVRERRRSGNVHPYYDGFFDRRQPLGVVVTWSRGKVTGEWIRSRIDYLQLADVVQEKLRRHELDLLPLWGADDGRQDYEGHQSVPFAEAEIAAISQDPSA